MERRMLTSLSLIAGSALVLVSGVAAAHGGGLSAAQAEQLVIPTWLFLVTGGGVVGASFLLASFVTDRSLLTAIHGWRRSLPAPVVALRWLGRALGLAGLAVVLVAGLLGPRDSLQNAAVLLVWSGWWAGYTMTVYLAGNSWPAVDPFRALAAPLGEARFEYPDGLGRWPAVVGLLGLVWLEVVSPLADDPRFLAAVVAAYLAVTLAGASLFGQDAWFSRIDPISNVFRLYGQLAPLQRTDDELALQLPGSGLVDELSADRSEVGLVVALVWATTYDGLVQTPAWGTVATAAVEASVPPVLLYASVLAAGFVTFAAAFWLAAWAARPLAPTYRTTDEFARLFAPPLLAIAAGYHLAHYLGFLLSLAPALAGALLAPLQLSSPPPLALPGWFGVVSVTLVLLGHLLAIWIAHGVAYERFPSRLQATRSQYPVTLVMVSYTMLSLWIVTRPFSDPPYV